MKDKVNKLVKYREPFRPFAPAILYEELENILLIQYQLLLWKKYYM